jgi:predicted transcriptional regulator of viral defense system
MGRIIHIEKIRKFVKETPVFRAKDVELIVGNREYSYLLIHNLCKRGEIKRITKSWYTSYDDPIVSVFAFRPSYLGLQEALSLRNIWEQETNVVIVSASKVRSGIREIMESRVIIHRIDPEYFFGFDFIRYNDLYLPVSDVEKTLIDLVYFNELPGEDVLQRLIKESNIVKLRNYLSKYPKPFRTRFTNLASCLLKEKVVTLPL